MSGSIRKHVQFVQTRKKNYFSSNEQEMHHFLYTYRCSIQLLPCILKEFIFYSRRVMLVPAFKFLSLHRNKRVFSPRYALRTTLQLPVWWLCWHFFNIPYPPKVPDLVFCDNTDWFDLWFIYARQSIWYVIEGTLPMRDSNYSHYIKRISHRGCHCSAGVCDHSLCAVD